MERMLIDLSKHNNPDLYQVEPDSCTSLQQATPRSLAASYDSRHVATVEHILRGPIGRWPCCQSELNGVMLNVHLPKKELPSLNLTFRAKGIMGV